jgi:hypothetical protein
MLANILAPATFNLDNVRAGPNPTLAYANQTNLPHMKLFVIALYINSPVSANGHFFDGPVLGHQKSVQCQNDAIMATLTGSIKGEGIRGITVKNV